MVRSETLQQIKQHYGLAESYPLAPLLQELLQLYRESESRCHQVAAYRAADMVTQKVKHDSFTRALHQTIERLVELLSSSCFGMGNRKRRRIEQRAARRRRRRADEARRAVLYRQYTALGCQQLKEAGDVDVDRVQGNRAEVKSWEQLVEEALLMDLYRLYLEGRGEEALEVESAKGCTFINELLERCSEIPFSSLEMGDFLEITARYRALVT